MSEPLRPDDLLIRRLYEELRAGRFTTALEQLRRFSPADMTSCVQALMIVACAGAGEYTQAADLVENTEHMGRGRLCFDVLRFFSEQNGRQNAKLLFQELLRRHPRDIVIYNALGECLNQAGEFEESIRILRTALDQNPHSVETLNLLAIAEFESGDFDRCLIHFREALDINPHTANGYSNLGCILSAAGLPDQSMKAHHKAISMCPDDAQIRLNHSIALLKNGMWAQGWQEHEWRLRLPQHTNLPPERMLPGLNEHDRLDGVVILITQEEGLGDTLMYLRYVSCLVARGALVHLWVPPELEALCRNIPGVYKVQVGGSLPEYDWHCPFISLARVFSATSERWGQKVPYLQVSKSKIREMSAFTPDGRKLSVGLVWGGAPRPEQTGAFMTDRRRSMPLSHLYKLKDVRNINLVCLQKGPYYKQLAEAPATFHISDPTEHLQTMEDTAALLMKLDLLVAVDTSIVHLAGAIGRPVIMMDRYDNCWRWQTDTEESLWYPDMRIIRQENPRDWSFVVSRVCDILGKIKKPKSGTKINLFDV
ncbi:tetratricopeptide repeat-containing glycosyltransferase family protein [Acetobacter sp. AN02]|uniref:tetratricopeptide repeat-containing glycosyltransferase family protein n=1 Tax=Acetobacter sp. AN02 TaxID=2894186 RepID=UPI00243419D3|nr:tetratricopeptide repeat-containing glycosyltransferase family protein [Acetobacter sp. AN02]MDG6094454.1 tetratricopeptide repeat-containing glycosyltransferase family protein [Acetobacter sp. AN02]